jgi:hypothetical protein
MTVLKHSKDKRHSNKIKASPLNRHYYNETYERPGINAEEIQTIKDAFKMFEESGITYAASKLLSHHFFKKDINKYY